MFSPSLQSNHAVHVCNSNMQYKSAILVSCSLGFLQSKPSTRGARAKVHISVLRKVKDSYHLVQVNSMAQEKNLLY